MVHKYNFAQLNKDHKVLDFMRWNYWAFGISICLIIISIIIIIVRGFNWGLYFTGGTVIEITMEKMVDINDLSNVLKNLEIEDLVLQKIGSSRDIIMRIPKITKVHDANSSQQLGNKVVNLINEFFKQNTIVKRIEFVGPSLGIDFVQSSVIALLIALISIKIYVWFRFEWRLAVGVVIALTHDIVITMGMLSLFNIEINQIMVASIMSVIGYSLNDSIVVSDRIRENFIRYSNLDSYQIFNLSLTQTLHRTLITSGTTLMVILILYIFGGPILEGFSLTMLIGVSIGTASSIYVASALALTLGIKREHLLQLPS